MGESRKHTQRLGGTCCAVKFSGSTSVYRGEPVANVGGFRNQMSLTAPGSTETVTVLRGGKRITLQVTIGQLTEDKLIAQGPAQSADEIGLTVQTLTPQLAEQFDAKPGEGVVGTEVRPGSTAAMAGIEISTAAGGEEYQRILRGSAG